MAMRNIILKKPQTPSPLVGMFDDLTLATLAKKLDEINEKLETLEAEKIGLEEDLENYSKNPSADYMRKNEITKDIANDTIACTRKILELEEQGKDLEKQIQNLRRIYGVPVKKHRSPASNQR